MSTHDDDNEPLPLMQKLLESPLVLLFIGVMVPMLIYNLWAVIDVLLIPVGK